MSLRRMRAGEQAWGMSEREKEIDQETGRKIERKRVIGRGDRERKRERTWPPCQPIPGGPLYLRGP